MKLLIASLLVTSASFAYTQEDGAFLDNAYDHLIHPKVTYNEDKSVQTENDVEAVIAKQSSVKSQAARGTCSIFSATAYLESLLIIKGDFDNSINLSEEWLEYVSLRGKTKDGSSAPANFAAIINNGIAKEATMPYIGENWVEVYNPLKESRCGHLKEKEQTACLVVHRDPKLFKMTDEQVLTTFKDQEFVSARKEAKALQVKYLKTSPRSFYLFSTSDVKELLNQGTPVVLEVDFFYGAWNHGKADEYGIGRNLDHWNKGIITAPELGSVDLEQSRKHPAGHSVLVVGYDDNKVVTKTVRMTDGTTKTFTYQGVYYIKNSWGTGSFGSEFEINGKRYPGYGMMVQKYANDKGSFFKLSL